MSYIQFTHPSLLLFFGIIILIKHIDSYAWWLFMQTAIRWLFFSDSKGFHRASIIQADAPRQKVSRFVEFGHNAHCGSRTPSSLPPSPSPPISSPSCEICYPERLYRLNPSMHFIMVLIHLCVSGMYCARDCLERVCVYECKCMSVRVVRLRPRLRAFLYIYASEFVSYIPHATWGLFAEIRLQPNLLDRWPDKHITFV